MKTTKYTFVLAMACLIGAGWQSALAETGGAEDLTVKQILEKVDQAEAAPSSQGRMLQVITTTGGQERTLEMISYTKDGTDKQLMRYIGPARVKGESILMLNDGDDIWYYSPRTDRARKIASHAKKKKVMGSDFTYEDMGSGSMAVKYEGNLLGPAKIDKKICYHLELTPTPEGPSYAKIQIWVDQETFLTRRVDYWEKGEKPFKRLLLSDFQMVDNRPTPMKYVMKNLREHSETRMEIKEMKYDVDLPDKLFTERNLKRR